MSIDNAQKLWWLEKENEAHTAIFDLVSRFQNQQPLRNERNLRSMALYGNMDTTGPNSFTYGRMGGAGPLPSNRVKINIISSMCDTVASIISKMKPRVTFLTEGGDAGLQTEAKNLSKYLSGMFYQNDIYSLHQAGFKDSTICDIGALKHYIENGKIKTERVMALELFTDPADCMYGTPSHMYQLKFIHKSVLIEMYPKLQRQIEAASEQIGRRVYTAVEFKDYVAVIEAWHLPLNDDGLHGRHVMAIDTATLCDEDYGQTYFPFTFFRWATMPMGFFGQSLAERLTGNQIEINKMLQIIQRSFALGASFKVFLEYGSKVVKEHINNDIGSIVYYNGTPPQFYVPKTVHEEYFRHLEWLIKNSYEEAGISQLSATGKKPAGLESAVAMREYNDIQTERFAITSQDYEKTYLQTARIYLDLSKKLYEDGVDLEVKAVNKKFIESIKWSDIDLDADSYIMKMFPTSMLPHEPAGRLAFVQEMMQAGLITPDWGLELLDFPDTENYLSLKNAVIEDILDTIDKIINHGKYTPPEPYQNLQLAIETMQNAYLRAKKDNVSEKRLQMMRDWMVNADAMMKPAAADAQMGSPAQASAQGQPSPDQMNSQQLAQPAAPIDPNLAPAQLLG